MATLSTDTGFDAGHAADTVHILSARRRAVIRPARPEDREAYVAAVGALSPHSRFQRFFSPQGPVNERDFDRLLDLTPTRQAVWLAIDAEDPDTGLGAARYAINGPASAEVALAVLDAVQGEGLGGALLDRVILGARGHGLTRLTAESLADNLAIARLLSSRGFSGRHSGPGVVSWQMSLESGA